MAESLIREPRESPPREESTREACLRCGEPDPAVTPLPVSSLGGVDVVRCQRCGTRCTGHGSARRLILTCDRCGLPFLADGPFPHDRQRCAGCREGDPVPDLPTTEVAAATEAEVLDALAPMWRFVGAPTLDAYLDRLLRQIAGRADPAPARPTLALFDDPSFRSLALPAGTILLSTGALSFVEDEAELAFVLGHEVAHAASGDAAILLSRLGFEAAARGAEDAASKGFAEAAEDLTVLGYGRRRERDADQRALEISLALGYEPDSAFRLLGRMESRIAAGDRRLAHTAFAHPPPGDRRRRLERALYGRVAESREGKVNREVLRRAVSQDRLRSVPAPRWKGPDREAPPRARSSLYLAKRIALVAVIAAGFGALAMTLLALLR